MHKQFPLTAICTVVAIALVACRSSSSAPTSSSGVQSPATATATITPIPNDKTTVVAGLTPAQAADLIARTVTGSRPLLFPNAIPDGWTGEASFPDHSDFFVRFASPDGSKMLSFALIAANGREPEAHTVQTEPKFHNDARSLYQVQDSTDPTSFRWLQWDEPGLYGANASSPTVPYYLDASGLTDAEFWAIANSLHPIQR